MEAVEVINLTKHYETVKAVDDISFRVEKGGVYVEYLGQMARGKLQLLKSICNLIIPDKGVILKICGEGNKSLQIEFQPYLKLEISTGD